MPHRLAVLAFLTGVVLSPITHAGAELNGRELWVENGPIRIRVWEKFTDDAAGKPVIILAHGSGTPGQESFDLQVPGKPTYSLMDFLAAEGFDVFAPDMRGFGRSTLPEDGVTTADACQDLIAVIDYVRLLREVESVGLLAWSWGTQYAGMAVMAHPQLISRYVSYAQMHAASPDIVLRREKLELFRQNTYMANSEEKWKARFTSMTPASANDMDTVDAFAKAAFAVQPKSAMGPQVDMVTLLPMVDATRILMPTMIIHGEFDDVANLEGLLPFFAALPNPDKKYVVVPNAGHMMHLQTGHRQFQKEVAAFFQRR